MNANLQPGRWPRRGDLAALRVPRSRDVVLRPSWATVGPALRPWHNRPNWWPN